MATRTPETVASEISGEKEKQANHLAQESDMHTKPIFIRDTYNGSGKLQGKVAIITGGDSGIGRAIAVHFAREGADVAIVYHSSEKDADETVTLVDKEGRKCLRFAGDVSKPEFAKDIVSKVVQALGKLDILINNAGITNHQDSITDLTPEQLQRTFAVNMFSCFYFAQAALPHLKEGAAIINTTSVNAYKGGARSIDYSASKGAQVAFTRALSNQLLNKGIRVNAVAPGPIWTPLVVANMSADQIDSFKEGSELKRAGQPCEVAPCYVFLASEDASYISGQTLHPNGGTVVNG